MRSKCIAVLIAFCLLITQASAQPYSIRANRWLNLRAAPSLSAAIAGTVAPGAILQVVDKPGRWLQINRNGGVVWLADWVNYSRVDGSAPTGSQQPAAQIDNCCFVDRQCQSDHEWTDGYWAYQNGQCAAPAQLQPATVAQPAVSAPAAVDNCCFVDRQCGSDQAWIDGYWAYQNRQCVGSASASVTARSGRWPRIEGSDAFVRHLAATLDLLQSKTPAWYNFVISGMDVIVEDYVPFVPGGVQTCAAWALAGERKVGLESCWTWIRSSTTGIPQLDQLDTAMALAHEACHVHTHQDGVYFATQAHEEAECRKFGTGVYVPLALALQRDLTRVEFIFSRAEALSLIRRSCSEGYKAELFCPTIQLLHGG